MSESWGMLGLLRSGSEHESVLSGAAAACGLSLQLPENIPEALSILKRKTTRALVVEAAAEGAEDLCHMARHHRFPGDVAVLVGSHVLTDAAFARAYAWGADDLVSLDSERAITARLTGVPKQVVLPRTTRRSALVVTPEGRTAAHITRTLGSAGYDVESAERPELAMEQAGWTTFELLVLNCQDSEISEVADLVRVALGTPAVLIWAKPEDIEPLSQALQGFDRVSVLNSQTPVENILFASNELVHQSEYPGARANRRHLHGTTVAFREPGADEDDHGFTYNIGRDGMYIRTLALPANNHVELEVRQPTTRKKLHLSGKVVWRRAFGFSGLAVAPPGFGLQIRAEPGTDYELWLEHFEDRPAPTSAPEDQQPSPPDPAASPQAPEVGSSPEVGSPADNASIPEPSSDREPSPPADTARQSARRAPDPEPAPAVELQGIPDSDPWFSSYSDPPPASTQRISRPSAPRQMATRPSRWPGILLALVLVGLLLALTFYLYSQTRAASMGF